MLKPPLNDSAYYYLSEARKWARFLSILGFIGLGLLVILGFAMGAIVDRLYNYEMGMSAIPSGFFIFIYLVIALIYFFPVYYLYRFSTDLGHSLQTGNEEELSSAFRFLKSHYKYIGIATIIFIAIYILAMIAGFFAVIFGAFMA